MNWRATFLSFLRDIFRYTLQSDGRIVVAGIKDTGYPGLGIHSFAVARYIRDSIVKVTFQTNPVSGGIISFNGTTYTNGQNGTTQSHRTVFRLALEPATV